MGMAYVDVSGATDELREMEFVEAGYKKCHPTPITNDRPFYQKKVYDADSSETRYFITVYEYDFREEELLPKGLHKVMYEANLQFHQKDGTTVNLVFSCDKPIEWIEAKAEELFTNLNCRNYSELY